MTHLHGDASREDDVGRLLRLARPDDELPAARLAAAKAAACEHWRRELERRSRRRHWTYAGLAAAAVVVVAVTLRLAFDTGADAAIVLAEVEAVRGDVRVIDALEAPASPAQRLAAGTRLVTGADGAAVLRMGSASLRVDARTSLRLESPTALRLESGAVYLDAVEGTGGLVVTTSFGSVRDVGTQFEVRLFEDSMLVRVREGEVVLDDAPGEAPITAGVELKVAPSGVTRSAIGRHEAAWDWAEALAPALEIEGRPARAFLDWVSRELGHELAFTGEEAMRKAEETVLHGSIRGLEPAESLDAVLPTSGLNYRIEGVRLLVDVAQPAN